MSWTRIVGSALLIALLGACTPRTLLPNVDSEMAAAEADRQKELVIRQELEDYERLSAISYPILVGGVSLCEDRVHATIGAMLLNSQAYEPEARSAAAAVLGPDDNLQVAYVVKGFPAAKAGLRKGDVLLKVNNADAPRGADALEAWNDMANDLLERGEPFKLTVLRNGSARTVRVVPREVCDYPVQLVQSEAINAFADGDAIYVTRGMMRFVETDQELALVLSHELAHNVMGHRDAKRGNTIAGGIGGLLLDVFAAASGVGTGGLFSDIGANIGSSAFSADFEREADYVGLYIMANAGLKIDGAARFWRRMATVNPSAIEIAGTHPTTPERFVAIETTIKEIRKKRAAGQPLEPEMKSES